MLHHPAIDPIALQLGPLAIRWYGLMYLLGFAAAWWLGRRRVNAPGSGWRMDELGDLIFYGALGAVLGGRLGYTLFYQPAYYLSHPLAIVQAWQGGMSFHGGLLGVLVACWLYGRKTGRGFFAVTDFVAPLVPTGLLAGRLGNFINGELWGRVTDVPWGMVFQGAGELPRHPSQLYQAGLEGALLFVIVWVYSARPRPAMAVSGVFLLSYGALRFIGEFARQPDAFIGFVAFDWLTMGQVLSLPMLAAGVVLLALVRRRGSGAS
ncbi:MAG: prolipoprotein diacylglyceryl transferase [Immundisolibacter sp.]|uniref:prolipoprotein diacylglyceryl transferase n=1 Tax=Immundisolibacter sp. TaxID=1934948 RepID=UPI003EE20C91